MSVPIFTPYASSRRTIQVNLEVPLGRVNMEVAWLSDDVDLNQLIEGVSVAVSRLLADLDREMTGD